MTTTETDFLSALKSHSKYKQRSHDTHHNIHVPELTYRLGLGTSATAQSSPDTKKNDDDDAFAPKPNLTNKQDIEIVLIGSSMLERFKTTGKDTRLGLLCENGKAWNAGVGGDGSENINWRVCEGLYDILSSQSAKHEEMSKDKDMAMTTATQTAKVDIKLWILASGTNDIHPKKGLRGKDVAAYKILVRACLRIAPGSKVLACDVFYRKDVDDSIVEGANRMLEGTVKEVNDEMGGGRVKWIEARKKIGMGMLVDHVHLDEEAYKVWEGVLWDELEREGVVS